MKTVIYITNNKIDKKIGELCKKNILESAEGLRLISVSQEPMDFGENICVGKIGGTSLTINQQMMAGLKEVNTKYVAIAEHDCLYTKEHFSFVPPDEGFFWYNTNAWFMQHGGSEKPEHTGMFSTWTERKANSQLTCATDIMIKATQDRISMMSDPWWKRRYPSGRIGEVGLMTQRQIDKLTTGKTLLHMKIKLEEYMMEYESRCWKSKIPNIDIRHEDNYTKCRRGHNRRQELRPWGTMEDVLNL